MWSVNTNFGRISQAIMERGGEMAALLFVDLDGFKAVNDTLGHEAGDHVLKGVAERLLASIRETDSVARIGGDEFALVLTDLNEMTDAASVARKLIDALREPFRYNGQNAVVGASVGIAVYPDHGITSEELIKLADEAMYAVKHKGRPCTLSSTRARTTTSSHRRAWRTLPQARPAPTRPGE